ncbi:hypothetical protein C8046_10525 [Serinibacter arcticus]|uniref:HNH nuclease domain-containing protein n=1 Tax=Serinibacter arcticus TaxID=1655435 RepID=A0A2U1ZVL2_9MICO|nr:HNH endonuclease signature motif containing protein [Serinibacter arcticus]PWD51018.1 hypothetical protein C8046_10525 [Serinibacter arcticus]
MYESGDGTGGDDRGPSAPSPSGTGLDRPASWDEAVETIARERRSSATVRDGDAPVGGSRALALATALDVDAPVDAHLVAALESLGPLAHEGGGDLTDAETLEVAAAWARVVAAGEAQVRRWLAVLSRRPASSPTWRDARGRRSDDAADEVRFRLGVSRRRGQQLIDEGRALGSTLGQVDDAFDRGWIDAGKAAIFVDLLACQPVEVAEAVCDEVVPVAADIDHAALRRRIQRVLVQVDPDGAGERHEKAARRRRVNAVRPLADGMAQFSAVLTAPAAIALVQACEATARAARARGDGRTLEQLCADALTAMGANALTAGQLELPEGLVRFSGRTARVQVVATAAVLRGDPAPVSAVVVAEHDLWNEPGDGATPGVLSVLTGADPGDDPYVDWEPRRFHRPGIDAPELIGYGAIPPSLVRALARGGGFTGGGGGGGPRAGGSGGSGDGVARPAWLRITAPVRPDEEAPPPTNGYRPSAPLDDWVRRRDLWCTAPGCEVPAAADDVDHVIPYPAGPTSEENLHALCRHDHLLKTRGSLTVTRHPDGTTTWRTRLGQAFHRDAQGVLTRRGLGAPTVPRRRRRAGDRPVTPERLAEMVAAHEAWERGDDPELPAPRDDGPWAHPPDDGWSPDRACAPDERWWVDDDEPDLGALPVDPGGPDPWPTIAA